MQLFLGYNAISGNFHRQKFVQFSNRNGRLTDERKERNEGIYHFKKDINAQS